MKRAWALFLGGGLLLACAAPSVAQALADPTRPPDARASREPREPSRTGLQSILLSPERKLAVIDGQTVKVGDRVGQARVLAIDVDSVRLSEGGTVKTMRLLPGTQKDESKPLMSPAESVEENRP